MTARRVIQMWALGSPLRSERSPRRSDSCRLIRYTSRGLPHPRFDSCFVFQIRRRPIRCVVRGEMKEILNQVVQAEEVAQANLTKRCEETAAIRSLLNTARLMDENQTPLRLKELETLEKVTEKIDKLTVFGGLEGVLKDVVRIQVPSA